MKKDEPKKKAADSPKSLGDKALERLKKFTGQDFGKDQAGIVIINEHCPQDGSLTGGKQAISGKFLDSHADKGIHLFQGELIVKSVFPAVLEVHGFRIIDQNAEFDPIRITWR